LPQNTIISTIPIYNIGGALNRNSTTRANQDGEIYGFRGNGSYDLNRDFIKSDTKQKFCGTLSQTQPRCFIDNHVSNGADYQYKLTYIMTQQNQLGTVLGTYLDTEMMPSIVLDLQKKNIETTPM
jgi:hypothetical protein